MSKVIFIILITLGITAGISTNASAGMDRNSISTSLQPERTIETVTKIAINSNTSRTCVNQQNVRFSGSPKSQPAGDALLGILLAARENGIEVKIVEDDYLLAAASCR